MDQSELVPCRPEGDIGNDCVKGDKADPPGMIRVLPVSERLHAGLLETRCKNCSADGGINIPLGFA
jgi:hypothetical protein